MSGTVTAGRIAGCLGMVIAGALTGAAGWLVVDLWFPGGLLLALLAVFGLFLGGGSPSGPATGWAAPWSAGSSRT